MLLIENIGNMITGEKLRKVRNLLGYSQDAVAVKMKVSQKTISNIEKSEKMNETQLNEYLSVIEKSRSWVDQIDKRININQENQMDLYKNGIANIPDGHQIKNDPKSPTEFLKSVVNHLETLIVKIKQINNKI